MMCWAPMVVRLALVVTITLIASSSASVIGPRQVVMGNNSYFDRRTLDEANAILARNVNGFKRCRRADKSKSKTTNGSMLATSQNAPTNQTAAAPPGMVQGNVTQGGGNFVQPPDEPMIPGTGGGGGGGPATASSGRPAISIGPHQPWKAMPASPQRTKSCQGSCASMQSDIEKCNNGGHVVISGSCSTSGMIVKGLNAIDIEIQGAITVTGGGGSAGGENALLTFQGSDVNIFGTGSINGNGPSYWKNGKGSSRPHLMKVVLSGGSVSQLHLVDSPMFFLVVVQSKNVVVSDLKLDVQPGGGEAYNTDGIDPSGSDNIVIQNCIINNDDDCVAIKAGCSNILVQGMSCTHSHGISIGSLSGSDTVQHVLVSNCRFSGGQAAARIKTKPGGGGNGLVSDVTYENIQVSGGANAIEINQCYENAGACKSSPSSVKIQDVHFRGFTGDSTVNMHAAGEGKGGEGAIGLIACGAAGSCSGITATDIRVSSKGGGGGGKLACSNAPALDLCA